MPLGFKFVLFLIPPTGYEEIIYAFIVSVPPLGGT